MGNAGTLYYTKKGNTMKSKILFFSPFLILCFFCLFSVCFSQGTNWHYITTLPVSNCAFSLNEANGNLYVIGGENFEPEWHTLDDVWIYDIAIDSLSSGAPMPAPRNLPSGTLVNGKIYAIGGHITPEQTATKTVEVYDIEENSWDTCASIPTARVWHAACVLEGKIYVMGGIPAFHRVDTISPYTLVERYDPESDTWDTCAPLPTGRWCLSACTLNGKIYAVGGYSKTTTFSLVEVYNPATDQWTTRQPMHLPRGEMGLAVSKGKIHAICGSMWDGKKNITTYQDFEVYDPDSDSWTLSPDLLPRGSVGLATVTVNERIYVASGVNTDTHLGVRAIYMYDYPVATIETRPYMEAADILHALIHEDCWLYIVPDEIPADPDSIAKYQIDSWDATDSTEIDLSLQNISIGSYLLYAVDLYNRIGYHVPHLSIVPEVHKVSVQVIDDYTMEILSGCQVFLNGKQFEKESEQALNITGWAYDTCSIQVTKNYYVSFDTTFVIESDTTLLISLLYAYQPELFLYSDSPIEKTDFLKMMMTQHGRIHVTPEGTPAMADSITKYTIKSINVSAGSTGAISLRDVPPGIYRIYGLSFVGRIATQSYAVQIIDHFPECFIQVRDAESNEFVDSCLFVVKCPIVFDEQDTIPGPQGEFDLTGFFYDTCSIEVAREGYAGFDTTIVVCTDTSFIIYLIPNIIEGVAESANQEIRIYPNPTRDLINVQTSEQGIYSLELINLSGQVIKHTEFSENSIQVDLSSYQSGIYLVRGVSGDQVTMGRVMKY
jgi:N-acetylneuraminic acid mutarotase